MCGACDRESRGDVQRAITHHTQETFFHSDGEEVRVIGIAGEWERAVIVRRSSPDFELVAHYVSDSHQAEWSDLHLTAPAAEVIPAEHDAAQFALYQELWKANRELKSLRLSMHPMVGDQERGHGRNRAWGMTFAQVCAAMNALAADGNEVIRGYSLRPSQVWAQDAELTGEVAALSARIDKMEATWREHRWTRWYPCLNADGHIHSSLRGCSTVYGDTDMGWATELSGKTVDEAITELGPRLCSVCFPDAPVEHCQSLRDITRADREAEKARKAAEKAAADAVKLLAADERFTSRRDGDRITTVAELKRLISKAVEERVELEWLNGDKGTPRQGWSEEWLATRRENQAQYVVECDEDAAQAERILVAREAAHPGWGATAEWIAKRRTAKERSERKDWGI
jgi:hypothetical protein